LEKLSDKKQVVSYYQKKRGLRGSYSATIGEDITKENIKQQGFETYVLKS